MIDLETKIVLNKVADIQIKALQYVIDNHLLLEYKSLILGYSSPLKPGVEDLENRASDLQEIYHRLKINSQLLYTFTDIHLMIVRHILFRMEEEWINDYQSGIHSLWDILFTIEEQRNPSINYIHYGK
jgi:hypothetical protein